MGKCEGRKSLAEMHPGNLSAIEAAVRRAAGAVVGGSNGKFWDEARGLEGVVSKRRDAPYRSGECRDWRKVKTDAWREANRERWC
jgi:ATP-dependent DNA ligase